MAKCKCDSCVYRASVNNPWKCDYIFIVGHSRGCNPDKECTKYKKGKRIQQPNNLQLAKNLLNDDYDI